MRTHINLPGFTLALLLGFSPTFSSAAGASAPSQDRYTPPAEVERAVAQFTGAATGETGGARTPVDPRLRLKACKLPLAASWYGKARTTVKVSCPSPDGWHIYVAIRHDNSTSAAKPMVQRGDTITVLVQGRGFTVQQSGEAMESGAKGDWIEIRTSREAAPVRARVERAGFAVIEAK